MSTTTTGPGVTTAGPQSLPHREVLQVMTGLLAALFTAMISNTIVATALPTIMADLNGTQTQYTWVITTSLLMMTISTAIWGKLSDLFDKKRLVQTSIVLFVIGSMVAGFSTSIAMMMGARAVQGIAMGGLVAMVQSIMGSIISPRERGRYAGYMGAVMGVATVSGPLLGGVITDGMGWRWSYFVCVPLAVVALILVQSKLRLPAVEPRKVTIDYAGGVMIAITATLPMLWVTFAGTSFDWASWQSAAYVSGFLISGTLAVLIELRAKEPIIPIHVLRNNTAALMIVASVAVGIAMFGSAIFMTQYFQLGLGYSPTKSGLMTLPLIITQTLASAIGGQIVSRTGRWKPTMVVGGFAMVIGLAGMGTMNHSTSYLAISIFMAVMGLGVGTLIQNIVLAVQNTVDVKDVGAASATIAFFRSLGGAIGVATLGAILAKEVGVRVQTGLADKGFSPGDVPGGDNGETDLDLGALPGPIRSVVQDAYADSIGHIFFITAIVAIVTLIAILVVRETRLRNTIAMTPTPSDDSEHVESPESPSTVTASATQSSASDTPEGPSAR